MVLAVVLSVMSVLAASSFENRNNMLILVVFDEFVVCSLF